MKEKPDKNFFFYDFVKVTGILPAFLYLLPRFHYPWGRPSVKGPVLVISNHSSLWDPVILLCTFVSRRPVFLATADLFSSRLSRWFFEHVHCIEINKEDFSISTFHKVTSELRNGSMVGVFPEGRVHEGSDILEQFKGGVVMMALHGKSDIIPVYVKQRKHWPQRTEIFIGNRIDNPCFEGIPAMTDINAFSDKLYEIECNLKNICDNGEEENNDC